jgi:hypothetical protein
VISPLWNGVGDAPTPQESSVGIVTVTSIGEEVVGTFARAACMSLPAARYPNPIQHRPQVRTLVALARGDRDRKRPALGVASEVYLGSKTPTALA